jgi:hypothetical protein
MKQTRQGGTFERQAPRWCEESRWCEEYGLDYERRRLAVTSIEQSTARQIIST